MRDFEDSTLWRVSAYERARRDSGGSGFVQLENESVLPTTLLADLRGLERSGSANDVLELVAACLRSKTPALLCVQHEEVVWPITVFPHQMVYHSPRDMALATAQGKATMKVLAVEPPGLRPPGHPKHDRIGAAEQYRPLLPLLWDLALNGPRHALLSEIGGKAAYRLAQTRMGERPHLSGALEPAIERLRRDSVSLRDLAAMPGMSVDRASRLLNALYLASGLIVTRSHPSAREEPRKSLFGLLKRR